MRRGAESDPETAPVVSDDAGATGSVPPASDWDSPAPLADDLRIDTARVLPSRSNAQVAAASEVIGGPVGVHAAIGRSRLWTPVRAVLLMALVGLSLSWFGKAGCLQQAPLPAADGASSTEQRLNWDNQRQYYGLCYTDIVALYGSQRLGVADLQQGTMPYRTFWFDGADESGPKRYVDQPVLIGAFMYAAAKATQGWQALVDGTPIPRQLDVVTFFNISALLLSLLWLLAVWATMQTDRRRMWLGALMALSPLIVVHAFTEFDIIPIALVAVALLCFARHRVIAAGAFLGLAASAALYPLLLIPALTVICFRRRQVTDLWTILLAGVLAWLAVNLPVLLSYPQGWSEFYQSWWYRGAELDSLYRLVSKVTGWAPPLPLLNALALTLLGAIIAGVVYLGLRSERTPTPAQLGFLLIAGALLVSKDPSPQHSLWLVPFAVLAVGRPRLVLAWMTVEALLWVPRMGLFLDAERKWLPEEWFTVALVIRALIVIALMAVVVRDLLARTRAPEPPAPALTASPYASAAG